MFSNTKIYVHQTTFVSTAAVFKYFCLIITPFTNIKDGNKKSTKFQNSLDETIEIPYARTVKFFRRDQQNSLNNTSKSP